MILRSHRLDRPWLALMLCGGLLVSAGAAQARQELLRWTHTDPGSVVAFEAHFGDQPGDYDQVVNLGKPTPDGSGIYSATVEVGDGDVYISLRAIGSASIQSPFSNERVREDAAGGGSGGGSGGGGGGGTAAIGAGILMPSASGSAQRFEFASNSIGDAINGWVDTASNNSLVTDDSLFVVDSLGGNRVMLTRSTDTDIHSHVVDSDVPWTEFVYRGRMAVDDSSASIGVTTYSQFPASDQYYRLARNGGDSFRIQGHPSLGCAGWNTGVVPTPGVWYEFELSVNAESSGNRIMAKIWPQGTPEPSGAQATCLDTSGSRSTGGTIGVWASGAGEKAWDDLEVVNPAPPVSTDPPLPPVLIQIVPAP